jgi:hypothetical protein
MRILSNLAITGSINSSGMILLPSFVSASDVTASYSASFGGVPDRLAMFTFQDLVPKVIGPGDINTEIGCRIRNRIDEREETLSFYNCIVSASADPDISPFNLNGTSTDTSGEYSGSLRRNYVNITGYISHQSYIVDEQNVEKLDFAFWLVPRSGNDLYIYNVDCTLSLLQIMQNAADRFGDLICNCLRSGEFIDLDINIRCAEGLPEPQGGTITFEKCFGKCTTTISLDRKRGLVGSGLIDESGSMVSISGYDVPWAVSSFNYELTAITGSESQPSASGELTSSTTPYFVIPSAPASPEVYYPFNSLLAGNILEKIPGLIYFDTNASTLFVYDGTGSWNPAGSSRYTESIGNGTASIFTVTHSKNTRDVHVTVRETSAPYEIVFPTINLTSANTARIDFSPTVPSVNQYTVIIS